MPFSMVLGLGLDNETGIKYLELDAGFLIGRLKVQIPDMPSFHFWDLEQNP